MARKCSPPSRPGAGPCTAAPGSVTTDDMSCSAAARTGRGAWPRPSACGGWRGGVRGAFRVWRWDGEKPKLVLDRQETVYEFGVAFRPGGKHLAVGHAD